MTDGAEGARPPLDHHRQRTVDVLCEQFANDAISMEEFERRVGVAHRATTSAELGQLLSDLPGANLPAQRTAAPQPVPERSYRVQAGPARERAFMVAVMGGSTRKGTWAPARRNFGLAVMGGVELDFREATLSPGVTDVQVFALWGGIEIIVPPGLNVESNGIGLLGGFDHVSEVSSSDPDAPTLRISGLACMGGVEITVRYAGESARDARRRRRLERKERKRLGRGG